MKLFRYLPRAIESWIGLAVGLPTLLRLALVPMAIGLASAALQEQWAMPAFLVDQLALGVFTAAWLRHTALDDAPPGPLPFRLGRREAFFSLFWLVANTFIAYPAAAIASSLSRATGLDAQMLVAPLLVVSFAALGTFFLLPVETAVEERGKDHRPVPDLLMQGGLAVGIGLLPVWGPPAAAVALLAAVPTPSPVAAKALVLLPQYLGAAAMAGYLGLVWRNLLAEAR